MMFTKIRIPELDFSPLLPGTISILIENVLTTKPVTRGIRMKEMIRKDEAP